MGEPPVNAGIENRLIRVASCVLTEHGLSGGPSLDAFLDERGLGFDSIGTFFLLSAVEKEFDVVMPECAWGPEMPETLRELLPYCSNQKRRSGSL
jgi:acyl carrier protein